MKLTICRLSRSCMLDGFVGAMRILILIVLVALVSLEFEIYSLRCAFFFPIFILSIPLKEFQVHIVCNFIEHNGHRQRLQKSMNNVKYECVRTIMFTDKHALVTYKIKQLVKHRSAIEVCAVCAEMQTKHELENTK